MRSSSHDAERALRRGRNTHARLHLIRGLWLAAFCACAQPFGAGGVLAQAPTDSGHAVVAPWLVGPFVGVAHNSPAGNYLGATPDRDHFFLGVEAVTTLIRFGVGRLSYTFQLLPLVIIHGSAVPEGYYPPPGSPPIANTAYAIGVAPFGLEIGVTAAKRVEFYLAAAAGGLFFTKPFPVPDAEQINFTLEYGIGLRLRTTRTQWLQVGYKYHHLSNAYTGLVNPGLDGHVLYAGYAWGIHLPR